MKKVLLILTVSILLLPLVSIAYLSMVQQWFFPALFDAEITFQNWLYLLSSDGPLLLNSIYSILLSLFIATVATSSGFVTSHLLSSSGKSKKLVRLSFLPYLIAPVILGVLVRYYFLKAGLTGTWLGVVVGQLLFIYPYAVIIMSTFWNDRIKQIAFQASTLGASSKYLYQTILIPLARPWLMICFIQCFLISWFEYGLTQVIGVGKVKTLTILTMQFVKEANPHFAAVAACLMVCPLVIFLIIGYFSLIKRTRLY